MLHNEFTAHAYITLSNCGGIEIMICHSGDGVYYRFNYGQDLTKEEIFEAEIEYTNDEDAAAYFSHKVEGTEDRQYFLNEAMRIN